LVEAVRVRRPNDGKKLQKNCSYDDRRRLFGDCNRDGTASDGYHDAPHDVDFQGRGAHI